MAREETNKWTRDRTFLEEHGGDMLVGAVCLLFLFLLVLGVSFLLLKPRVPGLSELFSAPPPPRPNPMTQKLNLAPGEQEIILFKPRPKAPPAGQQPPTPSQQKR